MAGLGWVGWLAGWLVGLVSLFVGWFVGRYCCFCVGGFVACKSTVIVNNPQISLAPKKHQRVSVLFYFFFAFCVFWNAFDIFIVVNLVRTFFKFKKKMKTTIAGGGSDFGSGKSPKFEFELWLLHCKFPLAERCLCYFGIFCKY